MVCLCRYVITYIYINVFMANPITCIYIYDIKNPSVDLYYYITTSKGD